jgi:antirestriction protein ArdC
MPAKKTTTAARPDVYQTVTDAIVARLESGQLPPWRQPWQSGHAAGPVSRPLRHNGTPYQGVNILWLWMAAEAHGYGNPYWLTFNQARDAGGSVRKGERCTHVVFASTFEKRETGPDGTVSRQRIPFLKTYAVFNAAQCDGLPAHYYQPATVPAVKVDPLPAVLDFARHTGADIREGGARAYYSPSGDYVQMPPAATFESPEAHAGTLTHELTHWTGHAARLARDFSGRFGSEAYAAEELVAELAAAFLAADLGFEPQPRDDHAAYLACWLKVMKADKRAIFTAASAASRAAAYLHSLQPGGAATAEDLEPAAEADDLEPAAA